MNIDNYAGYLDKALVSLVSQDLGSLLDSSFSLQPLLMAGRGELVTTGSLTFASVSFGSAGCIFFISFFLLLLFLNGVTPTMINYYKEVSLQFNNTAYS